MLKLMDKARGFTLTELMITLAVAGVLLGIAVPTFNGAIERNRLSSYSNELLGAFLYASSQARSTRQEVELCSSANGADCDGNWNSNNPLILRQADGTVIRRLSSPPGGSTLRVYAINFSWNNNTQQLTEVFPGGQSSEIRYSVRGQVMANNQGTEARRICINLGDSQTPFSLLPSGQVQIQPEAACP